MKQENDPNRENYYSMNSKLRKWNDLKILWGKMVQHEPFECCAGVIHSLFEVIAANVFYQLLNPRVHLLFHKHYECLMGVFGKDMKDYYFFVCYWLEHIPSVYSSDFYVDEITFNEQFTQTTR